MSASMIVFICVSAGLLFLGIVARVVKPEHKEPTPPDEVAGAVVCVGLLFYTAWGVSALGTYALEPYEVKIGYWQALFGSWALRLCTGKLALTRSWAEIAAYRMVNGK